LLVVLGGWRWGVWLGGLGGVVGGGGGGGGGGGLGGHLGSSVLKCLIGHLQMGRDEIEPLAFTPLASGDSLKYLQNSKGFELAC